MSPKRSQRIVRVREEARFSPYARPAEAKALEAGRPAYFEPPASGESPIQKLPLELRRKIFGLVLSKKSLSVLPKQMRRFGAAKRTGRIADGGMAIPLLLSCQQWCAEMTIMLYEEHMFEVGVHPSGIDFLDQPRTTAIGDLPEALVKSSERMQHFRIVFYATNPGDRLAPSNMRVSAEKLTQMLLSRDIPPTSIEVCFALSKTPFSPPIDSKGDVWALAEENVTHDPVTGKATVYRKARASIMHGVTNYELVSAPLMQLRGLHRVRFRFQPGCEDPALRGYIADFKDAVKSEPKSQEAARKADGNMMAINFTDLMTRRELVQFEGDSIEKLHEQLLARRQQETAQAIRIENINKLWPCFNSLEEFEELYENNGQDSFISIYDVMTLDHAETGFAEWDE